MFPEISSKTLNLQDLSRKSEESFFLKPEKGNIRTPLTKKLTKQNQIKAEGPRN